MDAASGFCTGLFFSVAHGASTEIKPSQFEHLLLYCVVVFSGCCILAVIRLLTSADVSRGSSCFFFSFDLKIEATLWDQSSSGI